MIVRTKSKRSVGVCLNAGESDGTFIRPPCDQYGKLTFLLNHGISYVCCHCRQAGRVEDERGKYKNDNPVVKEVRVEYNYDGVKNIYRETAIVREESLWIENPNSYTLYSPLTRTEKRALAVAERILSNLRQAESLPEDIPSTSEITLDLGWPKERWDENLGKIRRLWERLEKGCKRPTENR